MKTVGEQLAQWLEKRPDWKVADVAKAVRRYPTGEKVLRQNIEYLLKGKVKSPRFLPALARVMGTTTDALHNGLAVPDSAPLRDANLTTAAQSPVAGDVPMTAEFNPINVANTIHCLGKFLGMFDENSKTAIAGWMQTLVNKPNQAPDIARKMALLAAEGQEDISNNPVINAAMKRGRRRPVETQSGDL